MAGVGEKLSPLDFPRCASVLVNPRVAIATADVFKELGLKNGEILTGVADVVGSLAWPKEGAPAEELLKALTRGRNDLEVPAIRLQPVIGEVLAVLRETDGVHVARMSGSGATCFAIYEDQAAALGAAARLKAEHPAWWIHAGMLG